MVPDGLDVDRIVQGFTCGWWVSQNNARLVKVSHRLVILLALLRAKRGTVRAAHPRYLFTMTP